MFERMFCTDEQRWHGLLLRVALGFPVAYQGVQRIIAAGVAVDAVAQLVVGLALLAGLATRAAAFLIAFPALAQLIRTMETVPAAFGGFEGHAAVVGGAAVLLIEGGGRLSADSLIQARLVGCHLPTV